MQNKSLVEDHLKRSAARTKALQTLFDEKSWSDVVRESQEVVELCLKALLRHFNVLPPRVHDVSPALEENLERFDTKIHKDIKILITYSRSLRRDRELAYYGSDDLTPSEFYKKEDATEALKMARETLKKVSAWCK